MGGNGQPPERRPLLGKERVAVVAQVVPQGSVSGLAADPLRGLGDGGLRPGQSQVEAFTVMAGSQDREGRSCPLGAASNRFARGRARRPSSNRMRAVEAA